MKCVVGSHSVHAASRGVSATAPLPEPTALVRAGKSAVGQGVDKEEERASELGESLGEEGGGARAGRRGRGGSCGSGAH